MAISLTVAQQASLAGPLITICRCWDLIRRDGKALYITDFDRPLTIGAKIYYPSPGWAASAQVKAGGFKDRDREIKGVIDHDLITEEDLLAGLYRDATVKESVVDYTNIASGQFLKEVYWIRTTESNGQIWKANIESLVSWTKAPFGRNYDRDCPHDLGDAQCQVDLEALTLSDEVTAVWQTEEPTVLYPYAGIFFTNTITQPHPNFYRNGKLTFTSGANAGLTYDVKDIEEDYKITLWLEPIFPVEEGDEFDMIPGCPKTVEACDTYFDNLENHGGFPHLVGNDRLIKTPDAKE